jgi:SAM-dependent methyltransferase
MTDHPGVQFTAEYWDDRYGSSAQVWSGSPNPHLVTVAGALDPGDALDVGSGEGADAIWLAAAGWRVTGVDISAVALGRAAGVAGPVGSRITWDVADVLTWVPPVAAYNLVSAQFMHLPLPALTSLHERLTAATRPGGTLLVVQHHPDDIPSHGRHDLFMTADELVATLDPTMWSSIEITATDRTAPTTGSVDPVTRRDLVLVATRAR